VEDIFRDQFNRRVDSNDYRCIYLGNAIPSIIRGLSIALKKYEVLVEVSPLSNF
jgi:hypothetical protein